MPSAAPRASLTLPSCSPNYPRASRIGWTHARHGPFLNKSKSVIFVVVQSIVLLLVLKCRKGGHFARDCPGVSVDATVVDVPAAVVPVADVPVAK